MINFNDVKRSFVSSDQTDIFVQVKSNTNDNKLVWDVQTKGPCTFQSLHREMN